MKKLLFSLAIFLTLLGGTAMAQKATAGESFGNTLNLGLGIGYYGYVGRAMPVVHANFEFGVVRNFTLAPFITIFSYRNYRYWSNQNYYYRQTVVPIGVKGTYYFDMLLNAGSRWDFYGAGSLGFAIRSTRWQNGYNGDTFFEHSNSGLYLDAHIGVEYHASEKLGVFLDLSTGLSTLGLAIHL